MRVKEHSLELARGYGSSIQSTVQGSRFKAGFEVEVSLSAQEAKEVGGAWRWAHEHGHLVPVGDLDLEEKGAIFRGRTWYCRDGAAEIWGKIYGFQGGLLGS